MVSTDDSDGCTVCMGQRAMSEQGGENWTNPGGALGRKKREWLRACLLSENATTGCKKLGKKNTWQSVAVGRRRGKKTRCFVSKVRRILCLNNFFKSHQKNKQQNESIHLCLTFRRLDSFLEEIGRVRRVEHWVHVQEQIQINNTVHPTFTTPPAPCSPETPLRVEGGGDNLCGRLRWLIS